MQISTTAGWTWPLGPPLGRHGIHWLGICWLVSWNLDLSGFKYHRGFLFFVILWMPQWAVGFTKFCEKHQNGEKHGIIHFDIIHYCNDINRWHQPEYYHICSILIDHPYMVFIFLGSKMAALSSDGKSQERALVFEDRDSREQLGAPRSCGVWFGVILLYFIIYSVH